MKTIKRVGYIFSIVAFFLIIFSFSKVLAAPAQQFDVVFSEVMWSGSSTSPNDEFIELYNNTDSNIDLTGWQLTKLSESGEDLMLEIPSGIIPANGYFLISNSVQDHQFSDGESILNIAPDFVSSSVSLSNSKLQLKLYDGQWDNGRISIDIAGNGEDPTDFAGSNSSPKASMYRINVTSNGSIKDNWVTSVIQENLDDIVIDFATPHSSGKPIIEYFQVDKTQVDKTKLESIVFSAKITDPDGIDDIQSVTLNLSFVRSDYPIQNLCDKEDCGDLFPNDGIYTFKFTAVGSDNCDNYNSIIKVTDQKGLTNTSTVNFNIIQTSEEIRINEVLPSPEEGTDKEYIELYNKGSADVDLYQWQLDDKANSGSSPYIINDRVINAKSYQIFYKTETNLSLNNSGDCVRLILPNSIEAQTIEYSEADKGESYNNTDKGWFWSTTLTPNQVNIITVPISATKNSSKKTKTENNKDPPQIAIADLKNHEPESYVIITGIVSATPNLIATTYFYIQDETGGIQVYCYDKDFPNLQIGDKIQVTGRVSTSYDRRIKIDEAADILILENNYIIIPIIPTKDTKFENVEGMLVEIIGYVTETEGATFYLRDQWNRIIKIYIKEPTNIQKPRMYKGDLVKIIGIVDLTEKGFQILPRLQNDVDILNPIKDITEENKKSKSIVSVAQAADNSNSGFVLGLNKNNKYLVDFNQYQTQINLKNFVKYLVTICSILLIILIGEYSWKNRIRFKM